MKSLIFLLVPVLLWAQKTPFDPNSKLHLTANTNRVTAAECFENAPRGTDRGDQFKRDQVIMGCLDQLLNVNDPKSANDCKKLAGALSDASQKSDYLTKCKDAFAFSDCKMYAKNEAGVVKCIEKFYSTISVDQCKAEVAEVNSSGNAKLDAKLCDQAEGALQPASGRKAKGRATER